MRAGAGGEEAALWAGDLYRMLTRYAERRGFSIEPLRRRRQVHVRDQGRRRLLDVQVRGRHPPRPARARDRVPGPIHTSTATVAVLPEAEEVDVEIDPSDLQIDVYRSLRARAGSPSTRPTRRCGSRTAVRYRRLDAGREVQLQNREKALRGYARASTSGPRRAAGRACRRPPLAGRHGDRAEKIRTYNYASAACPTTASRSPSTISTRCSEASSTSSPPPCADERAGAAEQAGGCG